MNIIKTDMKITGGVAIETSHGVGKAIIIKLLPYKDKEKILKGAKNLAAKPTKTYRLERTFPRPCRPRGVNWCQR